jgi:hypothetical protein
MKGRLQRMALARIAGPARRHAIRRGQAILETAALLGYTRALKSSGGNWL